MKSKDELLADLADRAASRPTFCAYLLAAHDQAELCALLACDRPTLTRLRLCGRPRPGTDDTDRIAQALQLDPASLRILLAS